MKKFLYSICIIFTLTLLCACVTEKSESEETSRITNSNNALVTNSTTDVTVSTEENTTESTTEKITVFEKENVSLDSAVENQLCGAVDYVKRISENEILFILWQNDNTEHLYIYNTLSKEMKDTGKTFNSVPSIAEGIFREIIKPAMSQNISIRLYDGDFTLDFEKQLSDPRIQINHYAISDDSKSIAISDGDTVEFMNLETDEITTLQFKDNGGKHIKNVISFDDDNCFISCKTNNETTVFCITDRMLEPIKFVELDGEKAAPVVYDDFILVYEKSEIIPKKYGEATLIDKKTGEKKTVTFSSQIGEGQNVTASETGKYIMTSIVDQKSKNYDMPENVYRIYDTESGKKVYEKSLGFAEYGALNIYIDDICDRLYVFQYDMDSGKRKVTVSDLNSRG